MITTAPSVLFPSEGIHSAYARSTGFKSDPVGDVADDDVEKDAFVFEENARCRSVLPSVK
jgi:hypothetical protein